jgi:hypothetical protein
MVPCFAAPTTTLSLQEDTIKPLYVGKWINAGTVESIDLEKMLMVIRVLDTNYYLDNNYGMVTLMVNDSTKIKIGNDNFLNFEDLNVKDNIGFNGYWNGNILSANDIQLFQDPTNSRYFSNTYHNTSESTVTNSSTTTITPVISYHTQVMPDDPSLMTPTNKAYNTMTKGYTPSASLSNLEIAKLIIRTGGNNGARVNFRVRTFNGGSSDIIGENFTIKLYIRETPSDQYELLKTWDEQNVKSQDILSRDYFLTTPNPYVQLHNFQMKAELVDGAGNVFRTFEQDYAGTDIL